ncbi:hypothetical protein KCP69_13455 [Salmonella enterica subsp. enterica]|nr:hypothetical protein KCP69_13455 [Salmonella enterica subsp. enterica]
MRGRYSSNYGLSLRPREDLCRFKLANGKWVGFCASSSSSPKTAVALRTLHGVRGSCTGTTGRRGRSFIFGSSPADAISRWFTSIRLAFRQCFDLLSRVDRAKTIRCVNLMGKRFSRNAGIQSDTVTTASPVKTARRWLSMANDMGHSTSLSRADADSAATVARDPGYECHGNQERFWWYRRIRVRG